MNGEHILDGAGVLAIGAGLVVIALGNIILGCILTALGGGLLITVYLVEHRRQVKRGQNPEKPGILDVLDKL